MGEKRDEGGWKGIQHLVGFLPFRFRVLFYKASGPRRASGRHASTISINRRWATGLLCLRHEADRGLISSPSLHVGETLYISLPSKRMADGKKKFTPTNYLTLAQRELKSRPTFLFNSIRVNLATLQYRDSHDLSFFFL